MDDERTLEGRTAVVTGAGRGIGRAIALGLARCGAHVVCLSRTATQLAQTTAEIEALGGTASFHTLDITDASAVTLAVRTIVAARPRIDVWVNNAGQLHSIGPTWETDPEVWWADVRTNLYGTYLCTRAIVPHMLADGRGGRIINIAGGGTMAPLRFASGYGASKAAVARFTEGVAWELGEAPVKVFALNPGFVRTELTESQLRTEAGRTYMAYTERMLARGRDVSPDEAARVACFLASGRADALSGHIFDVHVDLEQMVARADAIRREQQFLLRLPRRIP